MEIHKILHQNNVKKMKKMECPFCNTSFPIDNFECSKCGAYRIAGDMWENRNLLKVEALELWLGYQ